MKNVIFNSSMPRACSTLLQNIFNQRPDCYATPTDGLVELLLGAREKFTYSDEFRASMDQDLMIDAWRNFCKEGMDGYLSTLTDKQNVFVKGRSYKSIIPFLQNFYKEDVKVVCMVRNLKAIVASLEKLHRKNPDKKSQWYIPEENRGTTVEKRVDMYLQNIPLSNSIDQMKDLLQQNLLGNILFIKAEDLSSRPQQIMSELYQVLGLTDHKHDFNNVEQTTLENDVIHSLDNDLHTIRKEVKPLKDDYVEILGKDVCDHIDREYYWYQSFFGYIS
jgi:hypothetical protein